MPSSSWELQRAIFSALTADGVLTALLGGAHIYDEVPPGIVPPYVTFAQSTVRDWSTDSDSGHEHLVTLHVWTRANGSRLAHLVMAAIRDRLHDADLPLDGYRLINLRHEFSDAARDGDGETQHGLVRYRAVTEPA